MKKPQIAILIICGVSAFASLISGKVPGFIASALIGIILALIFNRKKRDQKHTYCKTSHSTKITSSKESSTSNVSAQSLPQIQATNPTAYNAYIFNLDYIYQCKKKFIAFDVETTGLDPISDRIIEISAVVFENFEATSKFSTLINPYRPIPISASKINGIYDKDVLNSPNEYSAITSFAAFVGQETLSGDVILVAHNATFDIKFLLYALSRSGINADICFQDSLYLSKNLNLPVENNKLGTLATYFNISQKQAHRAENDAFVCGEVFIRLLEYKQRQHQKKIDELTPLELALCTWIKNILIQADCNTQLLTFNASTYLSVNCLYPVIKFKPKARRPYVLISEDERIPDGLESTPATKSEGNGLVRVFFEQPSDLYPLKELIIEKYLCTFKNANEYVSQSERKMKETAKTIDSQICI